ncbi:hypothetical protein Q667_15125 [Marinobacter sp. C1S70]|nr:hypothetical protein Q667_15125 [Marinobacter sp. C1S70]
MASTHWWCLGGQGSSTLIGLTLVIGVSVRCRFRREGVGVPGLLSAALSIGFFVIIVGEDWLES